MKTIKTRSTFLYKILPIFSMILLLSCINYQVSVLAQEDDDSNDNEKDLLKMKLSMNLNNLELKNNDRIKIVAYLNGEPLTKYLNLEQSMNQATGNFLTRTFEFNKTNEIAWVGADEYFVCGYVLKGEEPIQPNNYSKIKPYDCDEAETIEDADQTTARLFSTMKKYQKSVDLNTLNTKGNVSTKGIEDSDEVKITVITPIYDQKDVEFLTVIAMVKGEYQIKTVNIEDELKKAGGISDENYSDEDYIIKVPFVFKRSTEIGTIEVGDMFFGCASSGELGPPQNTECEKKFIKNFDKPNNMVTRHEEDLAPGGIYEKFS
jgi:hypothetical protein